MVRGALSALLGLEEDLDVVGAAADGEAAWRDLQRLKPDLLVTDIEMPGLSGLELAPQRIQRHELPTKVVIVHHLRARRVPASRAGCRRMRLSAEGCTGRGSGRSARARCIAAVGRSIRSWRWMRGAKPIRSTTASGKSCDWPAKASPPAKSPASSTCRRVTVRNYLSETIGKLGVGNRIEAYRLARQQGWL